MRIATFNVQRLRLRRSNGVARLDGARDEDMRADREANTAAIDAFDRRLTGEVLCGMDADVVALQEVFDLPTLDHFHDTVLIPTGARPYPYRVCLPGNDGRGFNVALMSRRPIDELTSNAALTSRDLELGPPSGRGGTERIFRRDCLMARVGELTLFVCHFKAPYPDAELAWAVRRLEAAAVRRLIERHFPYPETALWLVIGDLNEPADAARGGARAIAPLTQGFAVDLVERITPEERWSFHDPATDRYSRPDAMLSSHALAARWPDQSPYYVRTGLDREIARYQGPRFARVGRHRPHASDHAALAIDLPGL